MSCFLIVVVVWIFSVCLHEYGHAKVAFHGGDTSVEEKGYLSMNPAHYAHPVTSFILPVIFVIMGGLALPGGAVYINRNLLRSRGWETGVSLAGPGMNLILVVVLTLLLRLLLIPHYPMHVATIALAFVLQLQISSVFFNLLPVPPLDGYQALEPWLPQEWREFFAPVSRYGLFVVAIVFWNVQPLNQAFWELVWHVSDFLGVDSDTGWEGYRLFREGSRFLRFWEY